MCRGVLCFLFVAPYFLCTVFVSQFDSTCMDRPPLIVCTTQGSPAYNEELFICYERERERERAKKGGREGKSYEEGGRMSLLVIFFPAAPICVLLFLFLSYKKPPHWAVQIFLMIGAFVMSIAWLYVIANEVVSVLQALGLLAGISTGESWMKHEERGGEGERRGGREEGRERMGEGRGRMGGREEGRERGGEGRERMGEGRGRMGGREEGRGWEGEKRGGGGKGGREGEEESGRREDERE